MITQDYIRLCHQADVTRPQVLGNLQRLVIPYLQREATELAACRRQCEAAPEWAADWQAAGMVELEEQIHAAILEALARIAFDADPNPLAVHAA